MDYGEKEWTEMIMDGFPENSNDLERMIFLSYQILPGNLGKKILIKEHEKRDITEHIQEVRSQLDYISRDKV